MGKYYDRLVQLNENLSNELKDKGLFKEETKDKIEISPDVLSDEQKQDMLKDIGVDKEVVDGMKGDELNAALATSMNTDETKNESNGAVDLSEMDWDGPAIIKKEYPDGDSFYINDKEWSTDIQSAYEFPSKEDAADKIEELGGELMFIWPATMKKGETTDGEELVDESGDDAVLLRMDDDDLDIHGFVKWDIEEKVEFVDDENDADVFDTKADAKNMILDICDKFNYDPETFSIQHKTSQVNESDNWISVDPTNGQATTLS